MYYYKIGSIPLEAVEESDIQDRQAVYNELGKYAKAYSEGKRIYG